MRLPRWHRTQLKKKINKTHTDPLKKQTRTKVIDREKHGERHPVL